MQRKYTNINNTNSILRLFYYLTLIMLVIGIVVIISIPFFSLTEITFEKGINEWIYSAELPLNWRNPDNGPYFTLGGSISRHLLQIHI